jgi:hypothetical protein
MMAKPPFQWLEKVRQWFLQPYPNGLEDHTQWRGALFGFLFVTFFLYLFRPFGGNAFEGNNWEWFLECLAFGTVTLVVSIIWALIVQAFSTIFEEIRWCVWKEILAILVFLTLIGSANLLYAAYHYHQTITAQYFWVWQFATWSIGIFPVIFGVFIKQLRWMKRYHQEAAQLTRIVAEHPHPTRKSQQFIRLTGENQGEYLEMALQNLLYIVSADNYVIVYYLDNQNFKNKILRSSLKNVATQLEAFPQCFRCHRTHLVNLDQVTSVLGNAQGYKLQLAHGDQLIPVSRALNDTIRARLDAL